MYRRTLILLAGAGLLAVLAVAAVMAVSGAAYTTFNAHVDGPGKDVCKNTAINCNIYGAKEYVWLNGGPTANGLGPDGDYFFAVLAPGGQPNPNDQGGVADKNLSDDYDCYRNRIFTVTDGEVSAYGGYDCGGSYPLRARHWLDDGKSGAKPNWKPPYIRLFPYADTPNPGGVYIMAICSLDGGYPVVPRDCKYDAFKVKKGKTDYSFFLSGMKFDDVYGDGIKDLTDPGLASWDITITGTGPDGLPINAAVTTGAGGYWEYQSPVYTFTGTQMPVDVSLTVCEVLKPAWVQTFPNPPCHVVTFSPTGFDSFFELDFGNYDPVDVTACKARDLDGVQGGDTVPVAGWSVSRTEAGTVVDTQLTGANGCYTWTDLPVGVVYDVHEATKPGWEVLDGPDKVFEKAESGATYEYTFVNAVLEGCTPGFWQGGSAGGQAGGQWLWNEVDDPQWVASGGSPYNPYIHTTSFCGFFGCIGGSDMWYYVNPDMWLVNDDFHKAARSVTAAYLNAAWGMNYAYSTTELAAMWDNAVASGKYLELHTELDAANNAYGRTDGGPHCPISASGY